VARRPIVVLPLLLIALAAVGGTIWVLSGREADRARSTDERSGATPGPAGRPASSGTAAKGSLPGAPDQMPGATRPAPVVSLGGAPGRRAVGRVVDRSGAGVAGASIACLREPSLSRGLFEGSREPLGITALSDAGGRFEVAGLPTGQPLGLDVRHADYAPAEPPPFTASESQDTDLGDIVLDAGLLLIGNVLADDGRPLPGASVELTELGAPPPGEGGPQPRQTLTSADGEYRFDHLAPRQFTVEASSAGFVPRAATLALVFGASTGTARQDFKLLPADAAIAGRLLDEDDRPVPGVGLRLSQRDRNEHDYFIIDSETAADGGFRFGEVSGGLYQLEVQGAAWYLPQPLTVRGGDQSLEVRVHRARSVAGRLEGAAGAPRDFRVSVRPDGSTGARLLPDAPARLTVKAPAPPGRFVFGGLRPGPYRFDVEAAGYAFTSSADVILGEEQATAEVLIQLQTGGTLAGQVAPPEPGVAVELRASDYDPAAPMESMLPTPPLHGLATDTDAEGAFRLEHVPAGTYTLKARASDAPPLLVRDVLVTEGGTRDLGLLQLPRGGVIFGNVLGADGSPSVGARVTVITADQQEQAITDASGAFRLAPLPAGEYDLRAVPPTLWEALRFEAQAHVTLAAGRETPVLLTFVERTPNPH